MTAPAPGARDDATLRGAVVLVVAIVIGLALLARSGGGGGGDEEDASTDRGATTTVAEGSASTDASGSTDTLAPVQDNSTTTETPSTADPSTITVAVLNATGTGGLAGSKADILSSAGYQTAQGNFGGDNAETTTIYATPETQADANAIKTLLALGGATVAEKPADALGANGEDASAQVVVVLGADAAGGDSGAETDTTDTTLAE